MSDHASAMQGFSSMNILKMKVWSLHGQEASVERISPNAATRATLEHRLSDPLKRDTTMEDAEEIEDDFKCAICLVSSLPFHSLIS